MMSIINIDINEDDSANVLSVPSQCIGLGGFCSVDKELQTLWENGETDPWHYHD